MPKSGDKRAQRNGQSIFIAFGEPGERRAEEDMWEFEHNGAFKYRKRSLLCPDCCPPYPSPPTPSVCYEELTKVTYGKPGVKGNFLDVHLLVVCLSSTPHPLVVATLGLPASTQVANTICSASRHSKHKAKFPS